MTAEERMAYFQGEKRRSEVYQTGKNVNRNILRIKFLIAVIMLIAFLSLDYTGYQIYGIGSSDIITMVVTDFEITKL